MRAPALSLVLFGIGGCSLFLPAPVPADGEGEGAQSEGEGEGAQSEGEGEGGVEGEGEGGVEGEGEGGVEGEGEGVSCLFAGDCVSVLHDVSTAGVDVLVTGDGVAWIVDASGVARELRAGCDDCEDSDCVEGRVCVATGFALSAEDAAIAVLPGDDTRPDLIVRAGPEVGVLDSEENAFVPVGALFAGEAAVNISFFAAGRLSDGQFYAVGAVATGDFAGLPLQDGNEFATSAGDAISGMAIGADTLWLIVGEPRRLVTIDPIAGTALEERFRGNTAPVFGAGELVYTVDDDGIVYADVNDTNTQLLVPFGPDNVLDLAVADVNGDLNDEVFVGVDQGVLVFPRLDVANAGEQVFHALCLDKPKRLRTVDVDGDGRVDVVVVCDDGSLGFIFGG